MTEDTIRLNIILPAEVSNTLDEIIPRGMKTKVMLCLIDLYIKKAADSGYQAMAELLDGRMELSCVQNLDTTDV